MRPSLRLVLRLIVALLGGAGIASCTGDRDPELMYRNYLERLGNVTGIAVPADVAIEPIPPYPRTREIVLPELEIRVGVLTYLALGECRLLQAISERNSSLGRVQAASERLVYERSFLHRIRACEGEVQQSRPDDRAFLDQLAAIRLDKEANLPRVFWNATFAGPEFRTLLSTGTPALQRGESLALAEAEAALDHLTHLGRTLFEGPGPDGSLAGQLYPLQVQKSVGKLLHGLQVSQYYLAQASALLEQTAAANRLCPMGRKTPRGGYLFNVFVKFYAGEVQPYVSGLHRQGAGVLGKLHALRQATPVEPPGAFATFYDRWLNPESPGGLWL
ncbi:MAG: DUF3080 domain-containing protein, partial [Gammaproteobacteria bacterium]|nr:DUF3080 domain-containing protein [Gammaproteobacteria bacterium]